MQEEDIPGCVAEAARKQVVLEEGDDSDRSTVPS